MKQFLLALALIIAPIAAFTGYNMFVPGSPALAAASGDVLGDLSALKAIVTDVQAKVAAGDIPGATARITDFESAWDEAESGMRPMNADAWSNVDEAADHALKALRSKTPETAKVTETLATLQARLNAPTI
jgi:hypothetical protein